MMLFLATNVRQWNRNDRTEPGTNQRPKSAGFQVVEQGFVSYGPANPNHSCSMSKGGSLSDSFRHKQFAQDHCKLFNCDILIELSSGRFEIGSTTKQGRCPILPGNIKQQWIKV